VTSNTSQAGRRDAADENMIWIVIGAAIIAAGIVLFVLSRRRTPDPVTSFQRQIDALSPEARRSVVDRVQQIEDEKRSGEGGPDGP
jgi:hypothetical protein